MIAAFHRVSLRHFAAHRMRTASTVLGLALGVGAMIGVQLVSDSASRSFERTVDRMAGKAVLQITNGDVGVPEELLEEVRAVPGVGAATASIQGNLPMLGLDGERLYLFGIDLLVDQALRDYDSPEASIEDPLVFLAQPDSIALTSRFLLRHGLHEGDRIRVQAPSGATDLTIRATLDVKTGPATLFDGRLAVMDLFAAQKLLGLEGRFTQIDLGRAGNTDVSALQAALEKVVVGRGLVERPRRRGEMLERILSGNRAIFSIGAMLAIVVGLYLIFNTMTIAVAQRRREIGILRAVAMRRREVIRLILAESLALGAIGCVLGIPLGLGFARATAAVFAVDVSRRFLPINPGEVVLEPSAVVWGVGLGLLASLLAAMVPAREAVRISPLAALRREQGNLPPVGTRAIVVGVVLMGVAIALAFGTDVLDVEALRGLRQTADVCILVGISLLAPGLLRFVAAWVERMLSETSGPILSLASRSLLSGVRRFAIAATALIVSLATAIDLATMLSSMEGTIHRYLEANFSSIDLLVSTSPAASISDATPLPQTLADEIAALPNVHHVNASQWLRLPYEGRLIQLVAMDSDGYRKGFRSLDLVEGDEPSVLAAIEAGTGVVVNELFARRFGKKAGDVIHLRSPSGAVSFRIAAVNFELDELGGVILDRDRYRRLWRDDSFAFLSLMVEPGTNIERLADEIRRRFGDRYGLFVIKPQRFREWLEDLVAKAVAAGYPLIAVMIGIALLGLVNSLFASVLERVREIGILRAVGATRRQVARSVMIEAAIVGLAGAAAGVVVGSFHGYRSVAGLLRHTIGMTVFYRYPAAAAGFALVAGVVLAAAAGYLPGRSAARLKVTEALEYE